MKPRGAVVARVNRPWCVFVSCLVCWCFSDMCGLHPSTRAARSIYLGRWCRINSQISSLPRACWLFSDSFHPLRFQVSIVSRGGGVSSCCLLGLRSLCGISTITSTTLMMRFLLLSERHVFPLVLVLTPFCLSVSSGHFASPAVVLRERQASAAPVRAHPGAGGRRRQPGLRPCRRGRLPYIVARWWYAHRTEENDDVLETDGEIACDREESRRTPNARVVVVTKEKEG